MYEGDYAGIIMWTCGPSLWTQVYEAIGLLLFAIILCSSHW